ncbi:hypothetical protein GH714_025325 [Hevea brasiliensis]|uniref:Uncharacterized protein n=1 Tax=Hevea brasiliensis TaxID=3981 RepID=A0A6A6LSG6_HEVBR|nr:hypothetical protein GH714_025325 [Hevea brasiliensis]
MSDSTDEAKHIEKLYEFGERLNESKDKSQNVKDYQGIIDAAKTSIKAKQLAAQLIPRNYVLYLHIVVVEKVRVQAIRGLPLFCKDTPEYLSKIIDILVQLLVAEEIVERDAVHKALMYLLRQDVKASLTALFKHIGTTDEQGPEDVREKVLGFIRDKVFRLKAELLRPQEEMERHITDLIKKGLEDVTAAEFKMFMDFLRSLSIFGDKAPPERMKELLGIIEGQADLDAQFNISDGEHIDRLISCLYMALPFFLLPEERKLDLLKALAEISPYTLPQDSRQILPSIVQLLKNYMPRRKTGEERTLLMLNACYMHFTTHKAPNATNSLCGYKIVTGQPSDRLGEDFSELYKDLTERLSNVEELTRATMKKLTQGMAEHNKAMAAAKSDEAKDNIKTQKQNTTTGGKRPATTANGSGNMAKKGRGSGGLQNQLVNRALEGISHGGRGGTGGRGRGSSDHPHLPGERLHKHPAHSSDLTGTIFGKPDSAYGTSSESHGMFFIFSVKLTLAMQIVGFSVRVQQFNMGLYDTVVRLQDQTSSILDNGSSSSAEVSHLKVSIGRSFQTIDEENAVGEPQTAELDSGILG